MTILTTAANIPSTSSPSPVCSNSTESNASSSSSSSSSSPVSGMVSVHSAPLFISNQHLMQHFKQQQQQQQISSSEFSSSPLLKMSSSNEKTPAMASSTKPKIGFSIDSIVGTATSRSSPSPSSLDRSRSTSPADGHNGPANESGFHSVSPRPGSSTGTPVSIRSEPDQHLPVSQQQQQQQQQQSALPSPHPQMPLPPGWPTNAPPHPQMNPAYFEALANMRALYAQQPPFQPPHMMLPGPPPPPGAANQHWWLLAQARQQQQRLLAAAAVQRFPAGKFIEAIDDSLY